MILALVCFFLPSLRLSPRLFTLGAGVRAVVGCRVFKAWLLKTESLGRSSEREIYKVLVRKRCTVSEMRSAFEDFVGDFLSSIHGTIGLDEGHIVVVFDEHMKGFGIEIKIKG